jgi:peptide/nickel transport system substrate-binding protein
MSAERKLAPLLIIAVAGLLGSCDSEARRGVPAEPLTVKIGMFSTKRTASLDVAGLFTSEPLVAAAWNGRPVFKLAESIVEDAKDQRKWTVTLRSDVRFHSGELITAPVVRALMLHKIARNAPEIADIAALDDRRLLITLHKASSMKHEDLSTVQIDQGDEGNLGLRTGPFKLTSSQPTVLEAFNEYYQGRPAVQRLEIQQYPTHRAAWSVMMRGEVNFLHEVSRDQIEFVETSGDIRAYPLLRPYYTALVFNTRHQVLRRREARVAINEAVDREELVKNGMRGHGRVAEGPFWPYHWAYPLGRFPVAFNPEAAKLRLDGAGLRVRPSRVGRMPARFAFSCLILAGDDRFERIALLVQRQLYAIGIDMTIVPVNLDQLRARLASGDFDAFILETISGRILNWAYRTWHSPAPGAPAYLRTGYVAADQALDRLQLAHGDDEVRQALADVMHVMRTDPPAAFLVWPREARAVDAAIDIPYEKDRDVFGTLWQAKRRAAQVARQ